MSRRSRNILLGLVLGVAVNLVGCSGPDPAAVTPDTLASQPVAKPGQPIKKGNVADTTVYPAPPGVKTGLEGGKKN